MTNKTATFIDNSPPKADAPFLNILTTEMNNVIGIDGTAIDTTGLVNNQEANSVKSYVSQAGILCTDTGSGANAYILNASSPFTNPPLKIGARLRFNTVNANTGSSTITPFGQSAIACKKSDGVTNLSSGDIPAGTEVEFIYNGTNFVKIKNQTSATSTTQGINYLSLPANPITVGNNSSTPNTDIDFKAGTMTFHDGSGQALSTAMTKRLQSTGAWSAGNNGNMLLSGARANSSTYHLFALYKTDGTVDYGALLGVAGTDPNPTSPTNVLPTDYTKHEYLCPIITDGTGNIRTGIFKFSKGGSVNFEFNNYNSSPDINGTTLPTASRSLYTMASIPLGIEVRGFFEGAVVSSATIESCLVSATSPNQNDKTITFSSSFLVSNGSSNAISGGGQFFCLTNKSGQIGLKGSRARTVYVNVLGFELTKN
jgi:hypothetical protein